MVGDSEELGEDSEEEGSAFCGGLSSLGTEDGRGIVCWKRIVEERRAFRGLRSAWRRERVAGTWRKRAERLSAVAVVAGESRATYGREEGSVRKEAIVVDVDGRAVGRERARFSCGCCGRKLSRKMIGARESCYDIAVMSKFLYR